MWKCVWSFLDAHGSAVQGIAAIVQAVAAMVTVAVTAWLVVITRGYAQTTRDAMRVGREQFELYRKQFDREWEPAVHIRSVAEQTTVELEVTNLGRMAVVVTCLHVKFTGEQDETFTHPIPRPFPLASGNRDTVAILSRLEGMMKKLGVGQTREFGEGRTVRPTEIPLAIRFDYNALGTPHRTEWFNFKLYAVSGIATDLKGC